MGEQTSDPRSGIPSDLEAHLTDFPGLFDEETEIRLLDEQTANSLSAQLQGSVPLAKRMGLVVLDDSNTSDHHCFITSGPAAGMILNLTHDGEPQIAFDSLAKYLKEIRRLIREEEFIDEIVCDVEIDEPGNLDVEAYVGENLTSLLPEELCVYLSLIRTSNTSLLEQLSKHSDFIVREFTGMHLAKSPHKEAMHIAMQLAKDDVSQVASAGSRAVDAIARS